MHLDVTDRALLDRWQRDLPDDDRPFAAMAAALGITEADILARLQRLQSAGTISRVGAVVAPNRAGASTLAAMEVPPERLDEVAALVSAHPSVNHNYEREHDLNLWFVVTAADKAAVQTTLAELAATTGLVPLDLPLLEAFHIDLGFPLRWN